MAFNTNYVLIITPLIFVLNTHKHYTQHFTTQSVDPELLGRLKLFVFMLSILV